MPRNCETFMFSLVFIRPWLMQFVSLFQCVGKYATRVDARMGQIHCEIFALISPPLVILG